MKVTLRCSVKSCPRTIKVDWDDTMPKGTAFIESKCPWHEDGDFDEEDYFDKNNKELSAELEETK